MVDRSFFLNRVVLVQTGEEQKWQELLLLMKWRVKYMDIMFTGAHAYIWKLEIGDLLWTEQELQFQTNSSNVGSMFDL